MEIVVWGHLLSAIIFTVYGVACAISLVFMFSLEGYSKIEEKIYFPIMLSPKVNVLDTQIDYVDVWLKDNNKFAGLVLSVLSVVIIVAFYDIIKLLKIMYE